jgi:amino acid transporter
MKKDILTYIIFALVVVGKIIVLFIVNKNIDNNFSFYFVIGYVIFLLLSLLYFIIATVINLRKLKWFDIRKRLFRFVTLFILFSVTTYILKYMFRPSDIDVYDFGTPLGLALGLSFFDLMFSEEKEER